MPSSRHRTSLTDRLSNVFRVRRWTYALLLFLVVCSMGIWAFLFQWSGEAGALPVGKLYLMGSFQHPHDVLLTLDRDANGCFSASGNRVTWDDPQRTGVCANKPGLVWVEDVLVDLTLTSGYPTLSIAGGRFRAGDLLGSNADPMATQPLRAPFRAYGVPGVAAELQTCPTAGTGEVCLAIRDRLGRTARVRYDPATDSESVETPGYKESLALRSGDVLWLGMQPFAVEVGPSDELVLRRRAGGTSRPETDGAARTGDRRWLGRLWDLGLPEQTTEDTRPTSYQVYRLEERYMRGHLSSVRVNLELEDHLQRLIDEEYLCLRHGTTAYELRWQPLDRPGCGGASVDTARSADVAALYARVRSDNLRNATDALVQLTNAELETYDYLADPSRLMFTFDWSLRWFDPAPPSVRQGSMQPVPTATWGVRFGATRVQQLRQARDGERPPPPDVLLASTTGRHVVEVACNLLEGAATVTRAQQLRCHGVPVDSLAFDFRPRPLA